MDKQISLHKTFFLIIITIILFWLVDSLIVTTLNDSQFIDEFILKISPSNLYIRVFFSILVFAAYFVAINALKKIYQEQQKNIKIEHQLFLNEEKYRNLFNNMTSAFACHEIIYDEKNPYDYKFLEVNPAFETITGLKVEDIIGKTVKEVLPNTEKFWIEKYGEVAETGVVLSLERCLVALDKYYDIFAFSPERGFFATIFNDVTKRVQTENILKENEEKLKITFENIGDGIVVFDENLYITMINSAATKIVHFSTDDCIGLHVSNVFTENHFIFNKKTMEEIIRDVMINKTAYSINKAKFHCTGERKLCIDHKSKDYYIEDSISPIIDNNNNVLGAVIVFRDITEKVESEEKTKKLEEQLIQSQKMEALGQFSGGIAHDFNNIVTAINGYAELALDSCNDEKIKLYLSRIKDAGERSTELTRKILAFSRKQIIKTDPLNINIVIEKFIEILKRITGENILLISELKSTNKIMANENQIERILLNLVSNSRDAINSKKQSSDRKIIIETLDVTLDGEKGLFGDFIKISVSDTGIGMSCDIVKKAFEPFFTTKPKDQGSGMGLSTVYGIVHQNNGDIKVYSEEEIGTSIIILWPTTKEKIVLKDSIEKNLIRIRNKINKTILFVEDEESLRVLAKEFLSSKGFNVYIAENGYSALNELDLNSVDLIITDIVMPIMNGREFVDRAKEINPFVDVIYMSGYTEKYIVENGILDNNINFISKPYDLSKLLEEIDEIFEND